jgi:N-acyl-D-amino-acid deacylase
MQRLFRLRTLAVALATLIASLTGPAATGLSAQAAPRDPGPYDLLIRGGRIYDGTGNPWFQGDVAVRDGRIVAVGRLTEAEAGRVIDAQGLMIAPGFIDIHSHADDNTGRDSMYVRSPNRARREAPNIVAQGITTVVVNHDGRSPWPIREQRAQIESLGAGPNVMLMVGHGEVRRQVMGDDFMRPATDDEVTRMRSLVRQGLEEGAWGLSAGLEYVPGRWSTVDEVAALAEELVPFEGVYISHQRSEGTDPMWFWPSQDDPGPPTLLDAVQETIEISRRSGAKVVASHIKAKGAHYWGSSGAAIQLIQHAREEGLRVWADQYPYTTSGSDGSTVLLPRWALRPRPDATDDDREPADYLEEYLADPELAAKIRQDIAHEIRRRGGADRVLVLEHPTEAYVGENLREIADSRGVDPVEMAILLQTEGNRERRGGGRLRGFSMSEIDLDAYAAQPWVATVTDGGIALPTDGFVHARYYGTFPRKIRRYAMERGALSVEEAIRTSTSLPARIMGLKDRGQVREGMVADLVVFDLQTIRDRATFFEPHQYPDGIVHVLVNGEFVVDEGKLTGALAGELIPSSRADGRPRTENDG